MKLVVEILTPYMVHIIVGLAVFCLILLIILLMNLSRLKKIQKKYQAFMVKEDIDLESLLMHYAAKVNSVEEQQEDVKSQINKLNNELKYCTQKIGIVRYNAIERVGADLSFAIAMLDAEDNGVVLNGIYSRDGSYVYSKPVQKGESTYKLSDEEKEAIKQAKENNKAIA